MRKLSKESRRLAHKAVRWRRRVMRMSASLRVFVLYGIWLGAIAFFPLRAEAELSPKAVVHEELGSVIEELTSHFRGLGARLHGYLRGQDSVYERPLITFMLRHENELKLTEPQVENLERLRSKFERLAIRQRAEIRVAELELREPLDADEVDMGKVEDKVRQIERLRADLRLSRIRTIEEGKAQPSLDQREKLRKLLSGDSAFSLRN